MDCIYFETKEEIILMEINHYYMNSADNITELYIKTWIPKDKIIAILQITHGMLEYIDRYDDFARFMCKNHVLVVGQDILGHGDSVVNLSKRGYFAKENGNRVLLNDMYKIMDRVKHNYVDIPYFHLGHSMGSYLLRQFITMYGEKIDGAIILGTGYPPKIIVNFGVALTNIVGKFKGDMHRSTFIDNLSIGRFNKHYDNPNTGVDWLSSDEEVAENYMNDSKISPTFTLNAYHNMYKSIKYLHNKDKLRKIPKDLPIILLAGKKDPVGAFGKEVEKTKQSLEEVEISDLEMKLYPGARHELINEINKSEVYLDILNWLKKRVENNG